jgi:hypothetical protein
VKPAGRITSGTVRGAQQGKATHRITWRLDDEDDMGPVQGYVNGVHVFTVTPNAAGAYRTEPHLPGMRPRTKGTAQAALNWCEHVLAEWLRGMLTARAELSDPSGTVSP